MQSETVTDPTSLQLAMAEMGEGFKTPAVTNPLDVEVDMELLRTVPKKFCVEDDKSVNWVVKKIQSARQYGLQVKAWAEQELRRAEREEATLMFLFGRAMERWTKEEVEKLGGKRKSVPLPAGTVGFRTSNQRLVIDDEKVVMAWARSNCPTAIVTSERLLKTPLDDLMKATGEMPEAGAHVEPEAEKFYVR